MTEPARRRRRPAVSCTLCRRRKIRCNRETPCSNCVRSRNETCIYEAQPSAPSRRSRAGPNLDSRKNTESLSQISTPKSSAPSTSNATTLVNRPAADESTDAQHAAQTPGTTVETITSGLAGTYHVHGDRLSAKSHVSARSFMHKTRLFGQSHWFNGVALLFRDIIQTIEPHVRSETSKVSTGLRRCKYLAKVIKSQRAPPWPSPPTPDLPPKEVADELVDCYLRTTETVYRVLHVPTFMRDYEAVWTSDCAPSTAFLVQLKLVLAIGATTYDENFSLRDSAVRWIYEAQTWLSEPELKSRLNVESLQSSILHLLARETAGVGEGFVWISAGALLRTAVYMGLHRDPRFLAGCTALAAEMRRRLWNTILEMTLQSSMASGGPPLVSLDDFDTEPPGNFDDGQLVADDPVAKPDACFTQMSVAIALRKTFPLRLEVTRCLNKLGSRCTYEAALQLDTELRASYKSLRQSLQGRDATTEPSCSQFAACAVDFLMHRYMVSLHVPFFQPALCEAAYAFSRRVVVETSLKIWGSACPSSAITAAHSGAPSGREDFTRLIACGSGFFRISAFQASLLIAMELQAQLQEEEDSLGPVSLRPDLFSVLEEAKTWSLRCIEAGETNVKGYLGSCVVAAQIQGMLRRVGGDELSEMTVRAAEEAEERSLLVLEAKAGGSPGDEVPLSASLDIMEDWDFMMSDAMFNLGSPEPVG